MTILTLDRLNEYNYISVAYGPSFYFYEAG